MKKITILVPAYNEEESLPFLYERVSKIMNEVKDYEFELLFVNDGSKDNTLNEIKKLREQDKRVCYVDFSRNFGKEIGMIAGLDYATGDCVIIMDADLQDPPELIPEMIKLWEQGYDDVYAKRRSRAGETWLKKFTSKMYYRVLQSLTKVEIQKDTGDFRLLDRRCVNALKKMRETEFSKKFLTLLSTYHFDSVAPDQDYLNAMCNGKILYLNEEWDAMPAEGKEELKNPKLIHYNLFQKPWCYDNVQYEDVFWEYAKKTEYYEDILEFKKNYSDEKKKSDQECLGTLVGKGTIIPEKEVTFRKMFEQGKSIRA